MSDDLVFQARRDYGELIAKIVVWPKGLGIDVHLIGGNVVQLYPGGRKHLLEQPTGHVKFRRGLAALRGSVRRLLRRS
ncbi:hypothetical protein [Arthrobacter woluwensis]|uniref:Uncharacterized protein n=1 Tax=Arthrobacter woluwensis TaxID=156980 RepID=A0A1H4I6Z2_9MICC|nr:hypothetical protein [Arthrobacter woluwensis]SEB29675.1 hypothetical protein SAMN04489745_0071 [Arthrobacter woluwensis]